MNAMFQILKKITFNFSSCQAGLSGHPAEGADHGVARPHPVAQRRPRGGGCAAAEGAQPGGEASATEGILQGDQG